MRAHQAIALPRPSFSAMVAIVATLIAAALALELIFMFERPHALAAPTAMPTRGVGVEAITHNRSEEGLDASLSVGAEQIAHNRSEEALANH